MKNTQKNTTTATKTIKDCLWLWGQDPGAHHNTLDNIYKLPGSNRMTPFEGAHYLGVPNMCRVVIHGLPAIPYDQDAIVLDMLDKVVWSIADYGTTNRQEDGDADVKEVARQAKLHSNVIGAVMDDFFTKKHLEKYPPERVVQFKKDLKKLSGRQLELWVVAYVEMFEESFRPYLKECDVETMWTWKGVNLPELDNNLKRLKDLCGPGKRIMAGCYMWDYGGKTEMPMDLMKFQLDKYYEWLKKGEIEGIIFCSNCIADIGLEAVEYTREWIRKVGSETIRQ